MVTTIQLNENVKVALDRMKDRRNETYEEIILKMMNIVNERKRKQESLLIEQCKATAKDDLKIAKEWEAIEDLSEWEW